MIAAFVPALMPPLCAAIPALFRSHLDILERRGLRTHEPHACSSGGGIIHSIPTSAGLQQALDQTQTQTPESEGAMDCDVGEVDMLRHAAPPRHDGVVDAAMHVATGKKSIADLSMHDEEGAPFACVKLCLCHLVCGFFRGTLVVPGVGFRDETRCCLWGQPGVFVGGCRYWYSYVKRYTVCSIRICYRCLGMFMAISLQEASRRFTHGRHACWFA